MMMYYRGSVFIAAVVFLSACSSVSKPAVPDGSDRVSANDPVRVRALQDRVSQDRTLLTENNLLKAQVDVLNLKLNEMVTIVREALLLPPATAVKPMAPSISPIVPKSQSGPQSLGPISMGDLPKNSFTSTPSKVVMRVFHPWARTEFEPSAAVADALIVVTRDAPSIEVRGMTDSPFVNSIDRLIAMERAEKARNWLIANGTNPSKIRVKYFSSGNFYSENRTEQGRALNRRVEIEVPSSKATS